MQDRFSGDDIAGQIQPLEAAIVDPVRCLDLGSHHLGHRGPEPAEHVRHSLREQRSAIGGAAYGHPHRGHPCKRVVVCPHADHALQVARRIEELVGPVSHVGDGDAAIPPDHHVSGGPEFARPLTGPSDGSDQLSPGADHNDLRSARISSMNTLPDPSKATVPAMLNCAHSGAVAPPTR